jgi:hypothetical protein
VEERVVDGGPGLAEWGRAQVPVWADLVRGRAQVVPQVVEGGAAPEPVAVVDAVDDMELIDTAWSSVAGDSGLPRARLTVSGGKDELRSHYQVQEVGAACVSAALLAASALA